MKFFVFLLLFLSVALAHGAPSDLCDILQMKNCRGVTRQLRRNTFQSAPTTSTATSINPANVSFDKGMGLEAIFQPKNPVLFGLAAGTGKMGGALISGAMDNTFFGNRVPELDEAILDRYENDKRYQNKKLTGALGAKLFGQKNYGLDVGLIFKMHPEVKKVNPGAGVSARLGFLHFGGSIYKDDMFIDYTAYDQMGSGINYADLMGKDSTHETFTVTTYTVGARVKNFSFDVGNISSKLKYYSDKPTNIMLYSASFNYGSFLFNFALRKEHSQAKTVKSDDTLEFKENKSENFYGIQYSLNNHIIFGLNYNYFLLKDYSLVATFFI